MGFVVRCYDLLIKNGTVFDPKRGINSKMDVGIFEPNIADVFEPGTFPGKVCAHRVIDAEGLYVIPGLVDGHVHVLPGMWFNYPIEGLWKRGITACLDMGSASYASFSKNRKAVINDAPCNIQACLALTTVAETAGELEMYMQLEEEVRKERIKECFEMHPDVLCGIKAFIGRAETPTAELTHAVLKKAREVCDYVGCRLFVHVADPVVPLPEWIGYFNPGDNVTHAYNMGNILNQNNEVYPEAWEAKKRGVLFDSCRGSRNWCADVVGPAFQQGFYPDVISSDLTALSNDPNTSRLNIHMSECMAFGMSFEDVLYRVTDVPAGFMHNTPIGIKRGLPANLTVIDLNKGPHTFGDAYGAKYEGEFKIVPKATVVKGKVMFDDIGNDY